MKKNQVFVHSPNGPVVPTITHHATALTTRVPAAVVVLSEEDLTSGTTLVADYLTNTHFVEDVKKSVQTVYGRTTDLFEVAYVQFVKNTKCCKESFKSGQSLSKVLIDKKFKDLTLVFSDNFPATFFAEYLYGLTLYNWKNELKSHAVGEQPTGLFKPFTALTVVATHFNPNCEHHKYLQTIVGPHIEARELTYTRADVATPEYMANYCRKFAEKHTDKVTIEVISGDDLAKKGLNLIHAVGKGSANTPQMVTLYYKGNPEGKDDVYGLVGKGVCFDSGGLSLKQQLMDKMYTDKGGACTIFGIFKAVVALGLKINLVCTMGYVENFISDKCYRNSDIITSYKGLTVEILNTDAEGRLVLADCLAYQQDIYKPHTIFDFATLTGACIVALGGSAAGLFTANDELATELEAKSKNTHQTFWRLPLDAYPRENTTNPTADIQNLGKAPWAGAGTAAAFLEKFVDEGVKWAHIDIAGMTLLNNDIHGVRAIVEYYKAKIQA
ncbi:hypothetical protein ABPG74_004129 [Tetrahymena malaccensis]